MKIAAGIVAILLGFYSLAYVGLVGGLMGSAAGWLGSFGPANNSVTSWAQTVSLLSWVCPVSALVGGIVTFSHARTGGVLLFASAALHWQLLGFGAIGNLYIFALGATALLALIAGFLEADTKTVAAPNAYCPAPAGLGGMAPGPSISATSDAPPHVAGPSFGQHSKDSLYSLGRAGRTWWAGHSSSEKRKIVAISAVAVLGLLVLAGWAYRGPLAIELLGIRGVDFANAPIDVFGTACANNDLASAGLSSIPLENGRYSVATPVAYDFAIVGQVQYGNISGDLGRKEPDRAAFVGRCTQGTSSADVLFLYGLLNHTPVRVAAQALGSGATGGVRSFTIEDGVMRLVQNQGEAPCCQTGIRASMLVWFGNTLRVMKSTVETTVPDDPLPGKPEANAYLEAAITEAQNNDCAAAEGHLTQALSIEPLNPAANYYHASCLVNAGNIPDAMLPLRLAAQYGAEGPEGQLARNLAKELADRTSPNQGIDDGCAIPVPPTVPDGSSASAEDIAGAKLRTILFFRASRRFGICVAQTLDELRAQVAQSGRVLDQRVENKLSNPILRINRQAQILNDEVEAAVRLYDAAHPH